MKRIFLILITALFFASSCQNNKTPNVEEIKKQQEDSLQKTYSQLHDKYRTLWYRTNAQCFYDSSKKYGLLESGMSDKEISNMVWTIDTTPVNEPVICK